MTPNQGSVVVNTESEFFSQALWQKTSLIDKLEKIELGAHRRHPLVNEL